MNWLYLVPAVFCFFVGFIILFYAFMIGKKVVGFFISGASIMLSSYYFFRGFFLEEQYDTLTLLRSAVLFVALSSVSFLWGIMEQKFGRKKKIRIHYYE